MAANPSLRFSVIGINHEHIYGQTNLLLRAGAELFNMGWANQSADGLVCDGCGYVHTFVSRSVELWKPDGGYPSGG